MEENILSNEEGIEPGEDQDTGKQELEDATNEPRSAVEQSGEYQQAEAIQASLTDLADTAEAVDLPVKPANPAGGIEELPLPCPPGDLPEGSARLDAGGNTYSPNPGIPKDGSGWLYEVPENVQLQDDAHTTSQPLTDKAAHTKDVASSEEPIPREGKGPEAKAQKIYGGEPDELVPGAYRKEIADLPAPGEKGALGTEMRGDLGAATAGKSGLKGDETIDPSQLEYEPGHPPEPPDLDHGYGPPKNQLGLEEDNSVLGRQPKVREDLGDLEPAKYYSSNPGKAEGDNSSLPEDGDSDEQQIKPPENNPAALNETIDPSQLEYEPGHPPEPPDLDHGPPKDKLDIEDEDTVLGRMPKMREDLSDLKPAGSDESDEDD